MLSFSDGWSVRIFAHEINTVYSALVHGTEPLLDPLPLQYVNFALWQVEMFPFDFLN